MIKGRDFIIHGLQSLDSPIGSNCINIAREISKNNRVLYVNYPVDRLTLMRQRQNSLIRKRKNILKGKEDKLIKVNESMWNLYPKKVLESISGITYRPVFNIFNKSNNRKYANEIKDAVSKLGFKDYIVFNDSDFYRGLYFKELLQPAFSIYYTRDNMRETEFFKKNGAFYEDKIMAKSDLVVSNSVYLNDIAKKNNPNSVYVGQGCDIDHFDIELVNEIPHDIGRITYPVIGYIGALKSSRLDLEVLEHIAVSKPDWNVVLVGPEDEIFSISNLHNIKNIHFLGSKNEAQLPSYLAKFDVALNPQVLNELTIGNYPRKIDEYLAMGKPVVATKTRAMAVFNKHTYLAETKDEYVDFIDTALKENSQELEQERIRFARTHTWENNVEEIYNAIENTDIS